MRFAISNRVVFELLLMLLRTFVYSISFTTITNKVFGQLRVRALDPLRQRS